MPQLPKYSVDPRYLLSMIGPRDIRRHFPYSKVLITGGTSGIGQAMISHLVWHNIDVVIVGRNTQKLQALQALHPGKVTGFKFDILDLLNIVPFANMVMNLHPTIDCVWLNAGIQREFSMLNPRAIDFPQVAREYTTNYIAQVHLAMAFLPLLLRKSHLHPDPGLSGQILRQTALIVTTDQVPKLIPPDRANYHASKGALMIWVAALRLHCKDNEPASFDLIEIKPPCVASQLRMWGYAGDVLRVPTGLGLDRCSRKIWEDLMAGKHVICFDQYCEDFVPDDRIPLLYF